MFFILVAFLSIPFLNKNWVGHHHHHSTPTSLSKEGVTGTKSRLNCNGETHKGFNVGKTAPRMYLLHRCQFVPSCGCISSEVFSAVFFLPSNSQNFHSNLAPSSRYILHEPCKVITLQVHARTTFPNIDET